MLSVLMILLFTLIVVRLPIYGTSLHGVLEGLPLPTKNIFDSVGVIVANWLIEKLVRMERYKVRVMKVNIVIGDVIWEVVSCYCPQAGRSVNEKEEFYELMGKVVTSKKALVGGEVDGHVGSDMGGFGEVRGGFWDWVNKRWRDQIVELGSW